MSDTGYKLEIWERIRGRAESRIRRLVKAIQGRVLTDKSLVEFRDFRPVPWQFFDVLAKRADEWVRQVYGICLAEWSAVNERETQDFRRAVWAFKIDPFINQHLPDLLLRAAGFKTLERQLAIRGELKGYMPERHPILTPIVLRCWKVNENVRSHWKQQLVGQTTPDVDGAADLGKWAEGLLPEAKRFVRMVGAQPEDLREQFPALFGEVIGRLYGKKRQKFFEDARCRSMNVPELLALFAEVKNISGSRLQDLRKKWRRTVGITRERRSGKPSQKHS